MCNFLRRTHGILKKDTNLSLDDGTTFLKQGQVMMDAVTVVWGNSFSKIDMLLLLRNMRATTRFAREFIELDADDGDGRALVGVVGGQCFFPLGVAWYKCND